MLVGVVSDTHNNIINIENIINIFNKEEVNIVIHTGDISKPETLRLFTRLNCPMMGVFGNNDRIEEGLKEACNECNFNFQDPPFSLTLEDKKIAIFHEPELIDNYIKEHKDVHPHFQCLQCGKVDCLPVHVSLPEIPNRKIEISQLLIQGKCEACFA